MTTAPSIPGLSDVFITIEATNLPAPYADFIDPLKPLPADIAFFEKKVTYQEIAGTVAFVVGAGVVGLLSLLIGIAILFDHSNVTVYQTTNLGPIFFGITCLFVMGMMAQSIRLRRDLMRKQQRGEPTRLGIFLTPDSLLEVNEFGFTIIPRTHFRGLNGTMVKYFYNEQVKETRLPGALLRDEPSTLLSAIQRWAAVTVASGE